jgi:hypothetical protein
MKHWEIHHKHIQIIAFMDINITLVGFLLMVRVILLPPKSKKGKRHGVKVFWKFFIAENGETIWRGKHYQLLLKAHLRLIVINLK